MQQFAFLGTGPCNPNKNLKEVVTGLAVAIALLLLLFIARKINRANISPVLKTVSIVLITLIATLGTAATIFGTWVGLACSG